MLMARGDLQRLLRYVQDLPTAEAHADGRNSTFFAETITIKPIYAHTSPRTHRASPSKPITQKREVHELCMGKIVCVATSTVTITSEHCERLFLDEKFAVGQMFRRTGVPAAFDLLATGTGVDERTGRRTLWRRYTLGMDGFVCEIVEVFPDRDMFVRGTAWLLDSPIMPTSPIRLTFDPRRRHAQHAVVHAHTGLHRNA
jgi:hypothetical protein